ncbi:MAG: DinB family protein [Bryobacteraceae bacterium]
MAASAGSQTPDQTLTPETADLRAQFAAIKADAVDLVQGMTGPQFNWRPAPGMWSISECLIHLNIVGERYLRVIEPVVEDARAKSLTGNGPFAHGVLGRWILGQTEPPPRSRSKAPRSFTPPDDQPITAVVPTFYHVQDHLSLQVTAASGLNLRRIRVPAPGLGPVRFDLYLTFAWIAAHERRHLWQARRVRNDSRFPV